MFNYQSRYETENGIYAEEHAKLDKHEKSNVEGTNNVGYYQYTGDDGKLYRVDYSAGEEGFVPKVKYFIKISISDNYNL